VIVFLGLAAAVAILGVSCGKPADAQAAKSGKGSRAVPVTVAPVVLKDVPLALDTFGTTRAKASVAIKAQVDQVIQAVHFQQGQRVSPGDLLFTLDSRPYEAELVRAQAALSRDQVMAENAQEDVNRDADMLAQKVVSRQEYDKARATANSLAETLKVDRAVIAAAQLNVDNCRIFSPIAGQVGRILVDAGNLVKANDVSLVVINQISPIDVFFSVPQAELDRIRAYQVQGDLEVDATIPNDPDHPEKGRLTFIDNSVDTSNGTIELGASFPNEDERLWPGRYVTVRPVLTVQLGATLVPARAIQTGSAGQYVFVVKDDRNVEQRNVKVARFYGDDAVMEAGVKVGEQVVTDGQLQLEDGTRVEIASGEEKKAQPIATASASAGTSP
jgi:multidrug efflux system membrane fusion protein